MNGNIKATNLFIGSGSLGYPSYSFYGDPDTGILNPAANEIGIYNYGVERIRIDPYGRVGIENQFTERLKFGFSINYENMRKADYEREDALEIIKLEIAPIFYELAIGLLF